MIKTICLTLAETPQRDAAARIHFAERGLEDVSFYHGIHGLSSGLDTRFLYEQDLPGCGFKINHNVIGIWLSHRSLWAALELLDDEHFFVIENDAQFEPNWKARFDQAVLDAPPDFDFLFIGHCCVAGKPKTHIEGEVWEVLYPMCNHACIIAKKCLPFLIKACSRCWAPLDCQLMLEAFPHLKVYCLLPSAVGQFNTGLTA